MEKILQYISTATADKIPELLMTVLERYNEVFPDWEISTVSIQKDGTEREQIGRMIKILEEMRERHRDQ